MQVHLAHPYIFRKNQLHFETVQLSIPKMFLFLFVDKYHVKMLKSLKFLNPGPDKTSEVESRSSGRILIIRATSFINGIFEIASRARIYGFIKIFKRGPLPKISVAKFYKPFLVRFARYRFKIKK